MPKKIILLILLMLVSFNLYAEKVIPYGKENYFISLIKPYDQSFNNYALKNIYISRDNVRYEFCKKECFYVVLKSRADSDKPAAVSKNFVLYVDGDVLSLDLKPLLDVIVRNDTGKVYELADNVRPAMTEPDYNIRTIYFLIMALILIFMLTLYKSTSDIITAGLDRIEKYVTRLYPVLFFLILLFASYMRFRNIYLPLVEGGSALRLLFSYDSILYNLFISNDPRHPGLYFALLKPLILFSDSPEHTARILSASLSVLSVAVIGLIVRDAGSVNSLFAMLILSVHPEYIYRSREITDISLFVLTSLMAIGFLMKSEVTDKRLYKILFVLFVVLSCLSSYAAYVNLMAFLFYLLLTGRMKVYWKYLLTGLLFVLPYVFKILFSLREEFSTRAVADRFPHIVWGSNSLLEFSQRSLALLFAGEQTQILLLLLVIGLVLWYKNPEFNLLFLSLFLANLGFVLLSVFFRMMPYYFIFLPVSYILVVSYQKGSNLSLFGRLFSLIMLIFAFLSFYNNLKERFETTFIQGYHLRTNPALIVKTIKSLNVKDVVIDIENNKHTIGYYFFENPYDVLIKSGCDSTPDEVMICREDKSGRSITALTKTLSLSEGWEKESVNRFRQLPYEDFCFVYDVKYPNTILLGYVSNICTPVSLGEKYLVYRCSSQVR